MKCRNIVFFQCYKTQVCRNISLSALMQAATRKEGLHQPRTLNRLRFLNGKKVNMIYRNASNKRPSVSRVGAYLRVGAYSKRRLYFFFDFISNAKV